jgi:hypothetical protein
MSVKTPAAVPADDEAYITLHELAHRLSLSVDTIRRRKYPCIRIGHKTVRFHWPTVRAIVEGRVPAADDVR